MTPMSEFIFLYRTPSRPAREPLTETDRGTDGAIQGLGRKASEGGAPGEPGGAIRRHRWRRRPRRPGDSHRRPVCRDEGHRDRLLGDRCEGLRGGGRLTEGLPVLDDEGGMVEVRPILKM